MLPCASAPASGSGKCLNYQQPGSNAVALEQVTITLSGSAAELRSDLVVPEVIAAGTAADKGQTLLAPAPNGASDGFVFTTPAGGGASLSATTSAGKQQLTSVLIYGRVFGEDKLPYSCKK